MKGLHLAPIRPALARMYMDRTANKQRLSTISKPSRRCSAIERAQQMPSNARHSMMYLSRISVSLSPYQHPASDLCSRACQQVVVKHQRHHREPQNEGTFIMQHELEVSQ